MNPESFIEKNKREVFQMFLWKHLSENFWPISVQWPIRVWSWNILISGFYLFLFQLVETASNMMFFHVFAPFHMIFHMTFFAFYSILSNKWLKKTIVRLSRSIIWDSWAKQSTKVIKRFVWECLTFRIRWKRGKTYELEKTETEKTSKNSQKFSERCFQKYFKNTSWLFFSMQLPGLI